MTEPNDLTALAEACERAAEFINDAVPCYSRCGYECTLACWDKREPVISVLRTHARALREGRVTVNEGGPDA